VVNSFILTYNVFNVHPTLGQIQNHLTVNKYVDEYYSPFAGTFLIKSGQDFKVLSGSLKGFFEASTYILSQIHPPHTEGVLAPEVWTWLNFGLLPPPSNVGTLSGGLVR
jgi:hypothetical protein